MSDERREYFRIEDEVTLEYRVITESEMECVLFRIKDEVPDRFTAAASFASTSRQLKHLLNKEFSKYFTSFQMNVSIGSLRLLRIKNKLELYR